MVLNVDSNYWASPQVSRSTTILRIIPPRLPLPYTGFAPALAVAGWIALVEPRSNTMRMGEHRQQLAAATAKADKVYWFQPAGMDWSLDAVVAESPVPAVVVGDVDETGGTGGA